MYRANMVLIWIDFMTAWIRWFRSNTSTQHIKWHEFLRTRSVTEDRWTANWHCCWDVMSRTTFTLNKLSVSSAAVNPLFYSMSKRARESFATSASAKQNPVHCSGVIARNYSNKNADMYLSRTTSTRRSWRRLQAWKLASARFWVNKTTSEASSSGKLETPGTSSSGRPVCCKRSWKWKRKLSSSKYRWKNTYGRRSCT